MTQPSCMQCAHFSIIQIFYGEFASIIRWVLQLAKIPN